MRTFNWIRLGLVGLLLTLTACGTTLEKQENRFKRIKDGMEAAATKFPKMKVSILDKLKAFEGERSSIVKAGGEDAKTKLAQLNGRMEAFVAKVDPSQAKKKKPAQAKKGVKTKTSKALKGKAATVKSAAVKSAAVKSAAAVKPALGSKLGKSGSKLGTPTSLPTTVKPAAKPGTQPSKLGK